MSLDSASGDDKYQALAFYIVADVSYSMHESGPIISANTLLKEVHDAIVAAPVIADVVRLGVIDFSDDAQVLLRLGDLRDVTTIPELQVRGGTSFAAAFRRLRQEIERDIPALKGGQLPGLPAGGLLHHGRPADRQPGHAAGSVRRAHRQGLQVPAERHPVRGGRRDQGVRRPVGLPTAGEKQMRSYVAKDGADPAKAITEMAHLLISRHLASAGSVTDPSATAVLVLPEDEDGDWL